MAGIIQHSGLLFPRPYDSTEGFARVDPAGFVQAAYGSFPLFGAHTNNTVTLATETNPGYKQVSFVEDFYNRVHFTPPRLEFGAISADVQQVVSVWSAYLTPVTLDSLQVTADLGVSQVSGPAPPIGFASLGSQTFGFEATLEGIASFNTLTNFAFSTGETYRIVTSGDRAIVLDRAPNWGSNFVEALSFKTEIVHVSRSGKEQRRALRTEPRHAISYTVSVWAASRRALDGLLTRWRRRTVLAPLDPYRAVLADVVPAGETLVPLTGATPPWVRVGTQVRFVHRDMPGVRIGRVASFTADSVTLLAPTGVEYPAGTKMIWMLTARLDDGISTERITSEVSGVSVALSVSPGFDPVYTPPAAPQLLAGYELFLIEPNWASPVSIGWDNPLEVVDFERGIKGFFEHVDFSSFTMQQAFTGRRDGAIRALKDFFLRQRGQLGEFYAPTWTADIAPIARLDVDGVVIRVAGQDFARDFAGQTTHDAVVVILKDGTVLPRLLDTVYPVDDIIGSDSVVQVFGAWPRDIEVGEVAKICWLMRCRLATDTMQITWETDGVARTQFTFKTLEHLA